MSIPFRGRRSCLIELTIPVLGVALALCTPAAAQTQGDRFWIAGRYDGNRIIVYFDAVKFNGTLPSDAHKLASPVVTGFFEPVQPPESYIVHLQKGSGAEQFHLGDHYDLISDEGHIAMVTLTTLIACETDEGVGNDSFIGALATLNDNDLGYFRKYHYVLRRHNDVRRKAVNPKTEIPTVWVRLESEPVEFDTQTQIVALLSDRMKALATDAQRRRAERTSPLFQVSGFRVADGTLRYYARAFWKPEKDLDRSSYAVAAWIAPLPKLHTLALEKRTCGYEDFECVVPKLRNVVDLGDGKTGIIVDISGDDGASLELLEYRDGANLTQMRKLQFISAGE
jgi:hypothetical protein